MVIGVKLILAEQKLFIGASYYLVTLLLPRRTYDGA